MIMSEKGDKHENSVDFNSEVWLDLMSCITVKLCLQVCLSVCMCSHVCFFVSQMSESLRSENLQTVVLVK